jgi:aryl-alcohol dehydrogenase-like predicted oxidoreductase
MAGRLDNYRLLGRSGLRVSPLALGTMTFGVQASWGSTEGDAARILDIFIERGGNFIDTANFYAAGASEALLGRLLGERRERMVVSTKYSLTDRPGDPNASGNHRKSMVRTVERSLKRLATDYVDLLYLHMWDFRTPVEEILRAFDDLVRSGKVLYAGLSDLPAWQAARMQAIAEIRGWSPFIALQLSYSLIERTAERDLIPMAREMGMGVLPWSPLGGGILSGKYSGQDLAAESVDKGSRKAINAASGRLSLRNLKIADELKIVAGEMDRSPSQVALAWTLLNCAVTSPVLGVRTPAQLEDNLAALEVSFTAEQAARLDAASRIDLGFPHDLLAGPMQGFIFGDVTVERRD